MDSLRSRMTRSLVQFRTHGRSAAGIALPPVQLRKGGQHFDADSKFLDGGRRDARALVKQASLTNSSSVLELGCGPGRLPIGIIDELGGVGRYIGVDVEKEAIAWCRRHIKRPGFQFVHINAANERYNPAGSDDHRLPIGGSFDVAYAYSVFSHMRTQDVRAYLAEFSRLLAPSGLAFVTAFVEADVPDEAVNPEGYLGQSWKGPLHCVRFSRSHFECLVADAGLAIRDISHGTERDGQSPFLLGKS